jgi:type I restriction enzyme R subunit
MNSDSVTEDTLELQALDWFKEIGYAKYHGPDIAPEGKNEERKSFADVILVNRLKNKLFELNPKVPANGIDEAIRKILLFDITNPVLQNKRCHQYITDGVDVEYQTVHGNKPDKVWLIDFKNPENNEFIAINQFTVIENKNNRRPDIVIFINGLPLAVVELKNPSDPKTDVWEAYNQIQTYKNEIPSLFNYNAVAVISDGIHSRVGSLTAHQERFHVWRTIKSEKDAPTHLLSLEVVIRGLFNKERFLDFIRYFVAFEQKPKSDAAIKIIAAYHQFNAVRAAVNKTIQAIKGDKRIGTVWHSTGSGKSFTMAFYVGKAVVQNQLQNPTIIILTDRNDLDNQLFGQFSRVTQILRQTPKQIESRSDLVNALKVASGGIYFTTIQKFFPEKKGEEFPLLSERKNIIIIADEAHRSQYGFKEGFAIHLRNALPNASFIGFTGTPISTTDADTRAVFGDYISIYDIERSIQDGSTVPIYYESRLIKLTLDKSINLDTEIEDITENEEPSEKERIKSKWANLEALVSSENRIKEVAKDFISHFESRQDGKNGKAMIVCMSRRICIELYNELIKLRPEWHSQDDEKGAIKVIMTGAASDKEEWQQHIRTKKRREELAEHFRDEHSPFKIVIVRDMWLTGFDAPCLSTMYIDKPMKGHNLMQAIARVNRVFKNKDGGVVVDYIGIADSLRKTMNTYTESGGRGRPYLNKEEAIATMLEKYELCCQIMHGLNYKQALGNPIEVLKLLPSALEHILAQPDGKKRFSDAVYQLLKAFALATPHESALQIRHELIFFQNINGALNKNNPNTTLRLEDKEYVLRQLISKSVASEGVIDIFSAAGLKKPDISVLSDEFLAEVRNLPQRNLAIELLEKLIQGELKTKMKKNKVQERFFSEMLDSALRNYQNRAIETAKVIEDLIKMAKEIKEAHKRGKNLGLTDDELAFYDALNDHGTAKNILGDDILKKIAIDLVNTIKTNLDVDWMVKTTSKAKVRMAVKRLLKTSGYPPDKSEKATELILEQAEHLCQEWEN